MKASGRRTYEAFMNTAGFQTTLCKTRRPFTKGKMERLVRFVKQNFLAGRVFWNVTDLEPGCPGLVQLAEQHLSRGTFLRPQEVHEYSCRYPGVLSRCLLAALQGPFHVEYPGLCASKREEGFCCRFEGDLARSHCIPNGVCGGLGRLSGLPQPGIR